MPPSPLAGVSRGLGSQAAPTHTQWSEPPCHCREERGKVRGWLPYNQIFTVLSDRFLSHLRDLFICESISIVQ